MLVTGSRPEKGLEFDSLGVGVIGMENFIIVEQEVLLSLYEAKGISTAKPEYYAWRSVPDGSNPSPAKRLRVDSSATDDPDIVKKFRFPSGRDTDELLQTYNILHSPSFLIKVNSAIKNHT